MSNVINKYQTDITKIFGIGVEVLNGARALKGISLDLKLLAINGIVQAAKIGTSQGQSLITLSGFLSDLPIQIAPELNELEVQTSKLARDITLCAISVRRLMQYNISLGAIMDRMLKDLHSGYNASDFDLLDVKELSRLHINPIFNKATDLQKNNIKYLAHKNVTIIEDINAMLHESHNSISKARKKIENVKRNGFIANYMGSNILIESSYLSSDQKSFSGLVNNIKNIVKTLDTQLQAILENINKGDNILTTLIKIRTAN